MLLWGVCPNWLWSALTSFVVLFLLCFLFVCDLISCSVSMRACVLAVCVMCNARVRAWTLRCVAYLAGLRLPLLLFCCWFGVALYRQWWTSSQIYSWFCFCGSAFQTKKNTEAFLFVCLFCRDQNRKTTSALISLVLCPGHGEACCNTGSVSGCVL